MHANSLQYNQLEERLTNNNDSEQTIEELEETVMKLRGQLSDLDKLQLERDQLEDKLSTIEEEFKALVSVSKDSCSFKKENLQVLLPAI